MVQARQDFELAAKEKFSQRSSFACNNFQGDDGFSLTHIFRSVYLTGSAFTQQFQQPIAPVYNVTYFQTDCFLLPTLAMSNVPYLSAG